MARKRIVKKSTGLGDTVEKVTKATGIKKIVEKVFPDCGCQQRKEWLNKAFPYVNGQKKCMNEEQYNHYKLFKETYITKKIVIPNDEIKKIIQLYNSIFQVDVQGCSDCNAGHFVLKLDSVYLSYEESKLKG
jgi:hypothetical protein